MSSLSLLSDPWFYLVGIPAVLLTNISKGSLGLGLGIVAVPLMALHMPVPVVVTILVPILSLTDLVALWQYRGEWSWPLLRVVIPAALVGIALGALAIHHLSETWLRLCVGVIAIEFVRRRWMASRSFASADAQRFRPAQGFLWGSASGFASFMANAGEPALAMYLMPHQLTKRCFAGTTAAFFAVVNLAKLISFSMLGMFTRTTLLASIALLPFAVLGICAGFWMNRRMNVTLFYRFAYVILLVIGVRLVYTSVKVIL